MQFNKSIKRVNICTQTLFYRAFTLRVTNTHNAQSGKVNKVNNLFIIFSNDAKYYLPQTELNTFDKL